MAKIVYCSKTDDGMLIDAVEDNILIYDEIGGKVHVLNSTSKLIWDNIYENTKVEDLENLIFDSYDIKDEEKESVRQDIQEILNSFVQNNLISIKKIND